jgi:TfoX/Sxy family transcriptional regulator of competence genes
MIRAFAGVVAAIERERGVSRGRMFGSEGLKVGKQVFAMEVKGRLVVKLSIERAEELRRKGLAEAFDPGHGRPMKQWVAVSPESKVDWVALSREAFTFVRS